MACTCACSRRPLVGPSSQLVQLDCRRSYGRRYKPSRTKETNELLCQWPKPKGEVRPEPRHFANFYNYADGSKGMQLLTSPRPTVTFARDITNHPLWAFPGETKADTTDMTGQLGRFARRMGGSGGADDRLKTTQMFDSIFEESGAAPPPPSKKPPPPPSAAAGGAKGKGKKK